MVMEARLLTHEGLRHCTADFGTKYCTVYTCVLYIYIYIHIYVYTYRQTDGRTDGRTDIYAYINNELHT